MIPSASSSHGRNVRTTFIWLGLAAFVAAGCSDRTPTEPSEATPGAELSVVALSHGPGSISVEVRDGGTRYESVLVTVVHMLNGPFAHPGDETTILKGSTNSDGVVTFTGLPVGEYCAHIGSLAGIDFADDIPGLVVPFVTEEDIGSNQPDIGPAMIRKQGGTVRTIALTKDNYLAHCVNTDANTAPISLTTQQSSASVRITPLQTAKAEGKFLGLEGEFISANGWILLAFSQGQLPWFGIQELGLRPGTFPGLLAAVASELLEDQETTLFQGLPPGVKVALEALSGSFGTGQGLLIASLADKEIGAASSTTNLGEIQMEPLLCTMSTGKFANPGTATGGSLEIEGPVIDGFLANNQFKGTRSIAIWYDVVGSGTDELRMRFYSTGNQPTRTLSAPYSCNAAGCTQGSVSGSSNATATLYVNDLNGKKRLTWLVDNLPFATATGSNLASAEYRLDDYPEPARNTGARSFSPLPEVPLLGALCAVDAGNDPPFWIGT